VVAVVLHTPQQEVLVVLVAQVAVELVVQKVLDLLEVQLIQAAVVEVLVQITKVLEA
jgi:hypothetical protein